MAGEDGALRFVAEMQDNASRTAEALDSTLRGVGKALPDIMAAIDVDASGAVAGATQAAGAADDVVSSWDASGKASAAKYDATLTAGLKGVDAASAVKPAADQLPAGFDKSGKESGQSFSDALREKMKGAADRAGEAFQANKGALITAGAAAGLAAGLALREGVSGAIEREGLAAKLTAQLDLTAQESARFGTLAGQLYAGNYGDSLEEVNGAISSVVSSIGGIRTASDADLRGATQSALNLASAFDIEVSDAARSAGIVIKTGLAGSTTEAFDLITASAQAVGPSMVQPLLEAVNEYSTYFHGLGFSGEQAFSALANAAQGGEIALDKAGDAIKEFGIRSTDGSKSTAAVYEDLGLNMNNTVNAILAGGEGAQKATQQIVKGLLSIKDPGTQAVDALALFGTPLEDIGVDKIPTFLKSLQAGSGGLGDFTGRAEEMNATLGGTTGATIEGLRRQFQMTFATELGSIALPILSQVLTWATQFVGPLAVVASVLGTVATVVGVVSLATAAWTTAQTIASVATAVWTGLQWALTAALAAPITPILAVIAVVAALVAGLVWFFTQTETGQAIVQAVWGAIKTAIQATSDWITGTAVPAIVAAWQWIVQGAQSLWSSIVEVWTAITTAVSSAVTAVVDAVTGAWDAVWGATTSIFSAVAGFFQEWWPLLLAIFLPPIFLLLAAWNKWGDDILNAAKATWGFIRDSIIAPVNDFVQTVMIAIFKFAYDVKAKWDEMVLIATVAWRLLKTAVTDAVTAVVTAVTTTIASWVVALAAKWAEIVATARTVWAAIRGAIVDPVVAFIADVAARLVGFVQTILGPIQQARDAAGAKAREFLTVGSDIIDGIVQGVQNAAARLASTVAQAARNALDAAKNALGIHSPSRVFRDQIGVQIMAGWEAGMDGAGVVAAAEAVARDAAAAAERASIDATFGARAASAPMGSSLVSAGVAARSGASASSGGPVYLTARFTNPITGEELTAFAEAIADDRVDLAAAAREVSDRQNGRGR